MPPSWQSLVELMRDAPEDVRTLVRCCEVLSKRPQAELADGADAVAVVVAAVRFLIESGSPSSSLRLVVYALCALAAASAGNRQAAASAGALDAILAAMRSAIGDSALQYYGCTALGQLAEGGYVLRTEAAVEAAVSAIVAAYRAHPENAEVLAETQGVIRCIIFEGTQPLPDNVHDLLKPAAVKAAVKAGVIEMLIAQIHTHLRNDDEDVLHRCLLLLGYLYGPVELCDRRAALIVESITLVVALMTAQAADLRMQRQGCFVLGLIGRHTQDQAMIRTGGLSAAIVALRQFASDWNVQLNACGVIEMACKAAPLNTEFAVSRGAVAGVIAALRAHPGHEEVQRAACSALCAFTGSLTSERLQSTGIAAAIEPLTAALRAYPANPYLQQNGCGALALIVQQCLAPTQRAVEAGAIEAVLAGMIAISDAGERSPLNYQAGCDALESLLTLSAATELRAVCAVAAIEDVVMPTQGLQSEKPSDMEICAAVLQRVRAAARRHDRSRCINAACKRCAAARERGALCGLPSCGARARPDGKRLKRCGRCLVTAYCCEAHQREHWPTHRPLCRPAAPAADASAGADHEDASAAMERLSI
jgi:hypothetical protein